MSRLVIRCILLLLSLVLLFKRYDPYATLEKGYEAAKFSPFPQELMGNFPLQIPEYKGVDQLILLNNEWVIVAIKDREELLETINRKTGGELFLARDAFYEKVRLGLPDYRERRLYEALFNEHFKEARIEIGELDLDREDTYTITSKSDSAFKEQSSPLKVARTIQALDSKDRLDPITYAHFCYLHLPSPMKQGRDYTITLANGKEVSFVYDENSLVSWAIKVNQAGYLPKAGEKYAYAGGYLLSLGPLDLSKSSAFEVVDVLSGEVVFQGVTTLRAENPRFDVKPRDQETDPLDRPFMYGENLYEIDLSPLDREGIFFIRMKGVGRSFPFKHQNDAYGEVFYHTARNLFHRRSGFAIDPAFSPFPRKAYHTEPVYESQAIPFISPASAPKEYNVFDVIGKTIDTEKKTLDARGGWYDAADWDKRIPHYTAIFDLLYAYELKPEKFTDGQLHLPESFDGIPDILNEAIYGLSVWTKSMNDEGGVAGILESWTHTPLEHEPGAYSYAYSLRTKWSSLIYAAAAAQIAKLVNPFSKDLSNEYKELAEKAYSFGTNPKNSLGKIEIKAATKRGSGTPYTIEWEEKEEMIEPFLVQAKLRLYLLTGDESYLEGLGELASRALKPYKYPFGFIDFSPWIYYPFFYPEVSSHFPKIWIENLRKHYLDAADTLVAFSRDNPYRASLARHRDYWLAWGASVTTNYARTLLIAYTLTGEQSYFDTAVLNVDFMLGTNALNMSWITGVGFVYPVVLQDTFSEMHTFLDPIWGITPYGITGGRFHVLRNQIWKVEQGGEVFRFVDTENLSYPIFRNYSAHRSKNTAQNEYTVHETIASTIFCSAFLMNEGWMPSRSLIERRPRYNHLLFGYWILP